MKIKTLGLIGLGKMGLPVANRLLSAGFELYACDSSPAAATAASRAGAVVFASPALLASALSGKRLILLCVPAGKTLDALIAGLLPRLAKGDCLVDLGNSFYRDSVRRERELRRRGIGFIDVGMSGGVSGARDGACLMIGGARSLARKLDAVFGAISRPGHYMFFDSPGAGHLVKGFHNLVEYGYLQALAEGLESLAGISKKEKMPLRLSDVCAIWSRGSIIESRLVSDALTALKENPGLKGVSGSVRGQTAGEMRALLKLAAATGVKPFAGAAALKARAASLKNPTYAGKLTNAIRAVFGGHGEWKK